MKLIIYERGRVVGKIFLLRRTYRVYILIMSKEKIIRKYTRVLRIIYEYKYSYIMIYLKYLYDNIFIIKTINKLCVNYYKKRRTFYFVYVYHMISSTSYNLLKKYIFVRTIRIF